MTTAPRPPHEGADPRLAWRERLGRRWSAEAELSHAIHGIVVGSSVMVAASLHGTLGQVVVSVAVTLLVYWATERYADLLAAGARGKGLDRRRVVRALGRGWPMLQSCAAPGVVLLVVSAVGADLRTAVLAALGMSTVILAGLGYEAARRRGVAPAPAVGWAGASALLGVAVIVLKLVLH